MASKVQVCNIAILDAGGDAISSVPDGNKKESNLVVAHYDVALAFVLGEHPWRFAKKWASLAENTSYSFVDDTYEAAWALPADYVRWSDLENNGPSHMEFARRDSHLLTADYDEFEIEYIASITDTTKWPAYFISAFAAYLSWKIAPALRRKGARDKMDFAQAFMTALDNAKLKDSREDWQNETRITRHTNSNDTWIAARG